MEIIVLQLCGTIALMLAAIAKLLRDLNEFMHSVDPSGCPRHGFKFGKGVEFECSFMSKGLVIFKKNLKRCNILNILISACMKYNKPHRIEG